MAESRFDLDERVFERWRPDDQDPEVLTDVVTWQPYEDVPALSIDLEDFFARALR